MARGARSALVCSSESALDYGLLNDINLVPMPPNKALNKALILFAWTGYASSLAWR